MEILEKPNILLASFSGVDCRVGCRSDAPLCAVAPCREFPDIARFTRPACFRGAGYVFDVSYYTARPRTVAVQGGSDNICAAVGRCERPVSRRRETFIKAISVLMSARQTSACSQSSIVA